MIDLFSRNAHRQSQGPHNLYELYLECWREVRDAKSTEYPQFSSSNLISSTKNKIIDEFYDHITAAQWLNRFYIAGIGFVDGMLNCGLGTNENLSVAIANVIALTAAIAIEGNNFLEALTTRGQYDRNGGFKFSAQGLTEPQYNKAKRNLLKWAERTKKNNAFAPHS